MITRLINCGGIYGLEEEIQLLPDLSIDFIETESTIYWDVNVSESKNQAKVSVQITSFEIIINSKIIDSDFNTLEQEYLQKIGFEKQDNKWVNTIEIRPSDTEWIIKNNITIKPVISAWIIEVNFEEKIITIQ